MFLGEEIKRRHSNGAPKESITFAPAPGNKNSRKKGRLHSRIREQKSFVGKDI